VQINAEDTAESLAEKVQTKEHLLYPIVVRWFCEGRIRLGAEQVLFDGQPLNQPMILPDDPVTTSA
jgi:phosphoribosylglycinamide formyltransferase-1